MSNNGWSNQNQTRVVIVEGSPYSGLFFYSPAPGTGNLVGSWTAAAGTDPYGNAYPAGLMIQNGDSQFFINFVENGLVQQRWITGNPGVTAVHTAFLEATTEAFGNAEYDQLTMQGSINTTNTDAVSLSLLSSSTDGTQSAEIILQYINVGLSIVEQYLTMSYWGIILPAASITAVEPGTGLSESNPAVAETWHTPALASNWTVSGLTNPVRFRMQPDGTVRLDGAVMTTGAGPWPANADIFSVGADWAPLENMPFITRSAIDVTADQCTVNVLKTSGSVQNGQTFTAANQVLWFTGATYPVT